MIDIGRCLKESVNGEVALTIDDQFFPILTVGG